MKSLDTEYGMLILYPRDPRLKKGGWGERLRTG